MINQLNLENIIAEADLDAIAMTLYNKYFGSRGSVEQQPRLPDNATANELRIYDDAMWYWNAEKSSYSIDYIDATGVNQTLYGYFLKNGRSKKTAMIVHGWTAFAAEMGGWAKIYFDLGYNIFTPDLRGHGRSTEDTINFGALDSSDLVKWVEVCCEKEPETEEFSLFGISMGALTTLGAIGKFPENRKIMLSSLFVDSAFDDAQTLLTLELFQDPAVQGLDIVQMLIIKQKVDELFKRYQGACFSDLLTSSDVKKLSLPVLIIHGTEDALDTLKVPYNIFSDVMTNQKQYLLIEGAGHAGCFGMDYAGYKDTAINFLGRRELSPLISGYNLPHLYIVKNSEDIGDVHLPVMDSVDGDLSREINIRDIDFSNAGLYMAEAMVVNSRGVSSKKTLEVMYFNGGVDKLTAIPYAIGQPYVYVLYPYLKEDISIALLGIYQNDGSYHGRGTPDVNDNFAFFNVSDGVVNSESARVEVTVVSKLSGTDVVSVDILSVK
ncbi:alpha/beta fold hydrolase (plasmid) [Serratia sp. AXJ-M]|uniref:alpha/beta hydrolase n=1 Tax=Serratia sp. AXJ-M TaxID=2754727 RepID=UPI00397A5FAF